jgi:hypothetical protein
MYPPVEGIEDLGGESHAVARGNETVRDEEGTGGRVSLYRRLKITHHHFVA